MSAPWKAKPLQPAPRAKPLPARALRRNVPAGDNFLLLAQEDEGGWRTLLDGKGEAMLYPDHAMARAAAAGMATHYGLRVVAVEEGSECAHCGGPDEACDCGRCASCGERLPDPDQRFCHEMCEATHRADMRADQEPDDGPE